MLATRYESEKAKDCRQEQAAERVQNESSHVSGFLRVQMSGIVSHGRMREGPSPALGRLYITQISWFINYAAG
jgi:hypothetical protein